jgi:phosphate-selective porin OprO/OprP
VVQSDYRAYLTDEPPGSIPSEFLIRRARIYVEGTVFEWVDFRILPDFGQGQTVLQDAFVDLRPLAWAKLRAGKFKSPFGLERLVPEQYLVFVERGLPSDLVPDRDIGVSLHGDVSSGTLLYELAVLNGTYDNANVDGDVDHHKDLVARLYVNPLRPLGNRALRELGFGISGSWGDEAGSASTPLLPTLKTVGQQTFFSYLSGATPVVASGVHRRLSPQAYEALGPAAVLAELVYSQQSVAKSASPRALLTDRAWQLVGFWVVTGEHASYEGVLPAHPFSLAKRQFGALELAARYGELYVDPQAFPRFANPAQSARQAKGWGVTANWYFSREVKLALSFDQTHFKGGAALNGDRPTENALFGRLQVAF